jgi:hypothetical protein
MSKVVITLDPYPENADPDHETGLSEYGFEQLMSALATIGDVEDISKQEDES